MTTIKEVCQYIIDCSEYSNVGIEYFEYDGKDCTITYSQSPVNEGWDDND